MNFLHKCQGEGSAPLQPLQVRKQTVPEGYMAGRCPPALSLAATSLVSNPKVTEVSRRLSSKEEMSSLRTDCIPSVPVLQHHSELRWCVTSTAKDVYEGCPSSLLQIISIWRNIVRIMFWICKCEGWYSFKTYSITAEIKTQELLHLSKIIASFKKYFSHLIHTIFHTFRLENFKDNMFSYKQATPMCFSGLLHCFFSWADGSQRSYWQSSHAPSLLLHHLQNSWKHVPGVIVCSTDSMSSGECSPEPSHIQQEGPDKLRHGSGAGGPGRLPRRAAWYQNICSHAQSSLALPYEEASSNETEFLRYLFIYLFILFIGCVEKVFPGTGLEAKNSVAHQRNQLQAWDFSPVT